MERLKDEEAIITGGVAVLEKVERKIPLNTIHPGWSTML
jgi:hypothetical protein